MIKREKIFELKIEEDDDVSGIDSISLVDEPAIEVMWVAFKKEQEDFHIPDNEDELYLNKILGLGQSESDLVADGWEVYKIDNVSKEDFFTSDPNEPSSLDDKNFLTRFKYAKNPDAPGSIVKDTTRQFCRELVSADLVFRKEDIYFPNDFGSSALKWRGGYNCRHLWQRILYKRTADIGSASSTKGRVNIGPSYTIPGRKPQPNTTVAANPSFAKEKFEKISIDYDDTLSTDRGKELAKRLLAEGKDLSIVTRRQESDLGPVKAVAKELGIAENKVHATNGKLKWETIKRLGINKHIDNNPDELKAIKDNLPDVATQKFENPDVNGLPPYVDQLPKKKKSYLDEFEYLLSNQDFKKQYFASDDEKHIVLGPAMIPDMKIFRKDSLGNPYYVYFSPETIKMIASKYMKNKYTDNNDMMHDGEAVADVYVMESWIKESNNDKSTDYGFGDLPVGTWFVSMKINNPEIWSKVKDNQLNGFSVSGYFEEVAEFKKEELFLYKVAEILKNIKD
jgi:hypothetical protein